VNRRNIGLRQELQVQERRTALITGGASGLGAAAAQRLADDGVDTVTVDITPGADHRVDVSDPAAVQRLADEVGRVDILVNSAGTVGPNKRLWEVTPDEWDTTFAVNVRGTFTMCRAFVPAMRRNQWGRVINISSIAGKDGNPNLSAYSASKAAAVRRIKSGVATSAPTWTSCRPRRATNSRT
jgi:NAD(P)-dependent dehydrogenase (short-subunit alcohol dehydrogenase family)